MFLKHRLSQLFQSISLDKAVFFGLLTRAWNVFAGFITTLLILKKFTPEIQGYYYTFSALLALQIFVELGLGAVIVQFASHEWSLLSLNSNGQIVGDDSALSRLSSLARITIRWYALAAIIFIFGLSVGGYIFFSKSSNAYINWMLPWFFLCFLNGINVFMVPIWSLLEGCNQVGNLYANRFIQSLCSTISIWIALILGFKLWVPSISILAIFICAWIFVRRKYWIFFKTLFSHITGPSINWRAEVFPMQWRMALSWISGYFMSSFFVPVLFRYHGAVIAGQMGLTLNLTNVITFICMAWVSPKVPTFGVLIARKQFSELDRIFWRLMKIIFLVTVLAAVAIFAGVYIINVLGHPFSNRMLSPFPFALLLSAAVISSLSYLMVYYIMAHKKMPFLFVTIISGVLSGLVTFILGRRYAATGIAIGYFLVVCFACLLVAIIWRRCRIVWHRDGYSEVLA